MGRSHLIAFKSQTSCRRQRDAYEYEVSLAAEAQQDEAIEEVTVDAVDLFIAAHRACVRVERDRVKVVALCL